LMTTSFSSCNVPRKPFKEKFFYIIIGERGRWGGEVGGWGRRLCIGRGIDFSNAPTQG